MKIKINLLLIAALTIFNGALFSQCPTGTPPTLTCGTPMTVGPNSLSGQWGAISQNAPSCLPNGGKYSYSDIIQVTYQPGQSFLLDHHWSDNQNAETFIEILDGATSGCPSVACTSMSNTGVGGASGTSFTQNPNTGYNNNLASVTINADELGLTAGQTIYIKIATDPKCSGSCTDNSASGNGLYTISCIDFPENSCENSVFLAGDVSYTIDNQYASDNYSTADNSEGSLCGYSIENNVMFKWCTDPLNTSVEVVFNSVTVHEPSTGSLQFAILGGPCGGPYTRIQCQSTVNAPTTIAIDPANTQANTCYWIMMDGNGGSWWTVDMTMQDANPTPLPVDLISFNADIKDDFNNLKWTTSSERNNDYFLLERSNDAENWELIHREKGSGNSSSIMNYKYKDYSRKDEINYYRLSQVDFDGAKETFRMLAVNNSKDASHIVRVVNLMGQEVELEYEGLKIVYYSDGTTEKRY